MHSVKFYFGLLIISVIMIASCIYITNVPLVQATRGQWVGHTRQVISALNILKMHYYAEQLTHYKPINGDGLVRTKMHTTANVTEDIAHLQDLMEDNPEQLANLDRLRALAPDYSSQDADFTRIVTAMEAQEQQLLNERMAIWEEALNHTRLTVAIVQLLLFTLVVYGYTYFYKAVMRRQSMATYSKAQADRLGLIVDVLHKVATHKPNMHEIMQVITDHTLPLVQAEGSIIELVEGDEMVYRAASGSGAPHLGLRLKMSDSLSGYAIRHNQLMQCDDAETDPRVDKAACRRVGVRSMVVVPLQHYTRPIGVLKVLSSQRAAFDREDVHSLELLANLLSAKLNDAQIFAEIRQDNASLIGEREELRFTNAQLEEMGSTDSLTGLKNHRSFRERLVDEFNRAKRYNSSFSLLLIDIDHFKNFNDQFGHIAGNRALRFTADILKKLVRDTDFIARHGGEKFAIILPETDSADAAAMAETMRKRIAEAAWDFRNLTLTISVSTFNIDMIDTAALLERADQALYSAKQEGRNRVKIAV